MTRDIVVMVALLCSAAGCNLLVGDALEAATDASASKGGSDDGAIPDGGIAVLDEGSAVLDGGVALPDGGSVAECTAENTLFVEGEPGELLHPGAETVSAATWMTLNGTDHDTFAAAIPAGATRWEVAFSSLGLNQPLTPGFYGNAVTWPLTAHGHPTFWIYPDRDPPPVCQSVTGWFYITSIAGGPTSADFTEIVAAFEQRCDGEAAALRGCIHLRR